MKPIRVVLVDDSKVFMDALYSCLAQWDGVEIAGCAASGVEGLSLIESNKPDLVLMDIFMPVMNGMEASKRIVRHAGLPKVVLMTSLDAPGVQQFAPPDQRSRSCVCLPLGVLQKSQQSGPDLRRCRR